MASSLIVLSPDYAEVVQELVKISAHRPTSLLAEVIRRLHQVSQVRRIAGLTGPGWISTLTVTGLTR